MPSTVRAGCMAKLMYNAIQLISMAGDACNLRVCKCGRCGTEFMVSGVMNAKLCPSCGSTKLQGVNDDPKVRPPNLWIREVVKPSGKAYQYYMATWREGGATKNFHIGSVKRLSPEAAKDKALKLKLARLSPEAV